MEIDQVQVEKSANVSSPKNVEKRGPFGGHATR